MLIGLEKKLIRSHIEIYTSPVRKAHVSPYNGEPSSPAYTIRYNKAFRHCQGIKVSCFKYLLNGWILKTFYTRNTTCLFFVT